jgi:hypothetical protein
VVIAGKCFLAMRAGPLAPLGVLDVDVNLCRCDVQLHISHPPRGRKSQDVLVEIGVEHRKSLREEEAFSHIDSPTKNPDGPLCSAAEGGMTVLIGG